MRLQDKIPQSALRCLISLDALLDGLDPSLRKDIALFEKRLRVLPNKIVFDSNDQPLHIYVHSTGKVALFKDSELKDIILACPAGPRCIYGLVEALSGTPYALTMKTLSDSEFNVIDRDKLVVLIKNHPALCFRLAEILCRLYQHAVHTIKSH